MQWADEHIDALAGELGVDDGGRFRCPLPGHHGPARIGTPPDDPDGDPRLLCCRGRWRSLGEMAAAIAYGDDRLRTNIELATWTRRVAYGVGAFAPIDVELPPLPRESPAVAEQARIGFRLLVGLRWADGPHRPVAYAVRFGAAWNRLTFRESNVAIRALVDAEVIFQDGRAGRTPLYRPGAVVADPVGDLAARLVAEFDATEEPAR